jgi:uncharacterized protein YoxC
MQLRFVKIAGAVVALGLVVFAVNVLFNVKESA